LSGVRIQPSQARAFFIGEFSGRIGEIEDSVHLRVAINQGLGWVNSCMSNGTLALHSLVTLGYTEVTHQYKEIVHHLCGKTTSWKNKTFTQFYVLAKQWGLDIEFNGIVDTGIRLM
jgi:hypothetical protein